MAFDFPSSPTVGQQYQGYTWDGVVWKLASTAGIIWRYSYVATAGQTVFSGPDASGNTLSYLPGGVEVSRAGLLLPPTAFTATNGTSVTLSSGASAGEIVYIQAFNAFALTDALQKTLNGSDILSAATFRSNLGLSQYATAALGQLPSAQSSTVPAAGFIGQEVTASGSVGSLTSGNSANMCSLTLQPGVWDLGGYNAFGGPGATSSSDWITAISTLSGTTSSGILSNVHNRRPAGGDISETHIMPAVRVNPSVATTYYMNVQSTFTTSTYGCSGQMRAVRVN